MQVGWAIHASNYVSLRLDTAASVSRALWTLRACRQQKEQDQRFDEIFGEALEAISRMPMLLDSNDSASAGRTQRLEAWRRYASRALPINLLRCRQETASLARSLRKRGVAKLTGE